MKMIMIVYNYALQDEFLEALDECGVGGYTHIERATGRGNQGFHLGNVVWPVYNNVAFIAVPTEKLAKTVLSAVKEFKERFKGEGVQAWTWKVDNEV